MPKASTQTRSSACQMLPFVWHYLASFVPIPILRGRPHDKLAALLFLTAAELPPIFKAQETQT
jgi:hypothetical protein